MTDGDQVPARDSSAKDIGNPWILINNDRKFQQNGSRDGFRPRATPLHAQGGRRANPNLHEIRKVPTSFYICNFPSSVTVSGMWGRCEEWGTVSDVYIANHLSKSGHRFGFVRFLKVGKVEEMIINLRSMWFGSYKLFADVVKTFDDPVKRATQWPQTSQVKKKEIIGQSISVGMAFKGAAPLPMKEVKKMLWSVHHC
ncbi:hypothetical protein SSX86_016451 [Deinandra increscens subsp. villosa]|uniref:RRM domain-containing protein n=1 Tax=Deinandra increscens subsp. villosa TaxID=3103831 RepID=A0AAP0GVN6_9ASTR